MNGRPVRNRGSRQDGGVSAGQGKEVQVVGARQQTGYGPVSVTYLQGQKAPSHTE